MDAIVVDGRTLWLAVPDSDRTCSPWFEHDFADCIADQLCDAAPRPRGGLAQLIKLFLAEVNRIAGRDWFEGSVRINAMRLTGHGLLL